MTLWSETLYHLFTLLFARERNAVIFFVQLLLLSHYRIYCIYCFNNNKKNFSLTFSTKEFQFDWERVHGSQFSFTHSRYCIVFVIVTLSVFLLLLLASSNFGACLLIMSRSPAFINNIKWNGKSWGKEAFNIAFSTWHERHARPHTQTQPYLKCWITK